MLTTRTRSKPEAGSAAERQPPFGYRSTVNVCQARYSSARSRFSNQVRASSDSRVAAIHAYGKALMTCRSASLQASANCTRRRQVPHRPGPPQPRTSRPR